MKKIFKLIASLMLAVCILCSLNVGAMAETSTVTYRGNRHGFGFVPGSFYTSSDLFDGFKNVMPGDKLSETVYITNEARSCDYIKLYVRAVPHDGDNPLYPKVSQSGETVATMADFLSRLSMRVYHNGKLIYSASPEQLDGMANNVYLGTVRRDKSTQLNVELEVPIELGNEYANRVGEVDWVFVAEEFKDPPLIQTGQLNWPIPLMAGFGFALCLAGLVLMIRQRKRSDA